MRSSEQHGATAPSSCTWYVGAISGTSIDAISCALVSEQCEVGESLQHPYPEALQQELKYFTTHPNELNVIELCRLDNLVGAAFAEAIALLIEKSLITKQEIAAIGCHGQTIFHDIEKQPTNSIQIGNPNIVAAYTGIDVVADIRRADMASGGQGAPLAPWFHRCIFQTKEEKRLIVNLGGIANLTYLAQGEDVIGFDTGPANTLLDQWIMKCRQQPFDADGDWARTGKTNTTLLNALLEDAYFSAPAPKSTGTDYFNLQWLEQTLKTLRLAISNEDIQATLLKLTTQTIVDAAITIGEIDQVILCGGGARNDFLVESLQRAFGSTAVSKSEDFSWDAEVVEAAMFAWLARARMRNEPASLHTVTGAKKNRVLGAVYSAT